MGRSSIYAILGPLPPADAAGRRDPTMQPQRQNLIFGLILGFLIGGLAAGALMLSYLREDPETPVAAGDAAASTPEPPPPAPIWQTAPGFKLEVDAEGFHGPVSIAFLNNPGSEPDSPLYLVSELRGQIKVVFRDRSVGVFGEISEAYLASTVLPRDSAAFGLHSLCFDPEDRYLFSTSVYPRDGEVFNRISVWQSTGSVPWAEGRVVKELRAPFADLPGVLGHSAGHCFVGSDGKLWLGSGDGGRHHESHDPTSSAGKILRLNLDLTAARDNPFYDPRNPGGIQSYVYTMGLRNPWAIAEGPGGKVFAADNGPSVDRLVVARPGHDYPWHGHDASFNYDHLMLWTRPVGPASLLYIASSPTFPFVTNALLLASASRTRLMLIPLTADGEIRDVPAVVLKRPVPSYPTETLTGTAIGPDGFYVAHMVYDQEEFFKPSAILKLVPGSFQQQVLHVEGSELLLASGCFGCHAFNGEGHQLAPALDGVARRAELKLRDPSYAARLQALDDHADAAIADLSEIRRGLLDGDMDGRVRRWLRAKIATPNFDQPATEMVFQDLMVQDVDALADFLAENAR